MTTTIRRDKDACDLLDEDHRKVKQLFDEYEWLVGARVQSACVSKQKLAAQICQELTIHASIEEEIFYPAVRAAIRDDSLLIEAQVEHAWANDLIAQINAADPSNPLFDPLVAVLGEYVHHHVKEERAEMFPKARAARRLDLVALRDALQARKEQLMGESAPA
jgi:hemerythrin superfamily protein